MFESVLISAFSIAMFVYWFRGTVRLLLAEKLDRRRVSRVAADHGLLLSTASDALVSTPDKDVFEWLERDRKALDMLVPRVRRQSLEILLLRADYQIMRVCWRVCRTLSPALARGALHEMGKILDTFAACVEPSPKVFFRA